MDKENIKSENIKSEIDYSLVNDDFHPFPLKESTEKIERRRPRALGESQNHSSLHFPELSTSGLSALGSLNLTPCPDGEFEKSNLSIQAGLDVSPPKRKDSFFSNYSESSRINDDEKDITTPDFMRQMEKSLGKDFATLANEADKITPTSRTTKKQYIKQEYKQEYIFGDYHAYR